MPFKEKVITLDELMKRLNYLKRQSGYILAWRSDWNPNESLTGKYPITVIDELGHSTVKAFNAIQSLYFKLKRYNESAGHILRNPGRGIKGKDLGWPIVIKFFAMDKNGNAIVLVKHKSGKAVSIQTGGNLPYIHSFVQHHGSREAWLTYMNGGPTAHSMVIEIIEYLKKYGTPLQKSWVAGISTTGKTKINPGRKARNYPFYVLYNLGVNHHGSISGWQGVKISNTNDMRFIQQVLKSGLVSGSGQTFATLQGINSYLKRNWPKSATPVKNTDTPEVKFPQELTRGYVHRCSRCGGSTSQAENICEACTGKRPASNPSRGTADETMAHELYLYGANDSDLYRQQKHPIELNLTKRWKKGTYQPELAVKLWKYFADTVTQKYHKEFGGPGKWSDLANVPTRLMTAKLFEEHHRGELELGNFTEK